MFVGRLAAEKNIDLLVDAFEEIATKRPHAKLVLVGDFEYRKTLEEHATKLCAQDRVIFTGAIPREQLGAAYANAKVFAFPSLTDTQGLVLHEAANAGVPLVIIDREVNELVIEGETGYFAENSVGSLAGALTKVLELSAADYKEMSIAVKKRASLFSERKQTEKCIKLYQHLLAEKSSLVAVK